MKTVLGFTDEITTCACCSKTNLKGTYAVEVDGALTYFGSTCAFKKHGISKEETKAADKAYKAEQAEIYHAQLVGYKGNSVVEARVFRAELRKQVDEAFKNW